MSSRVSIRSILFLFAMLSTFTVSSINIVFRIGDPKTKKSLSGVKGTVLDKDTVKIAEAISNNLGLIQFENLKKNTPFTIIFTKDDIEGYIFKTNGLDQDFDGGIIWFGENPSTLLDEVVVHADSKSYKGMAIMAIPSPIDLKMSTNALELLGLQHLPGLWTDPVTRSATINGKQVIWKVNGIPKPFSSVLAINPSRILKFEYFDYPTSQYLDNPNVGGIIDVILKERIEGGQGYAYLEIPVNTKRLQALVDADLNYKDSQFEILYHEDFNDRLKTFQTNTTFLDPSGEIVMKETLDGVKSKMMYLQNTINAVYSLQNKRGFVLSSMFSMTFYNDKRGCDGLLTRYKNGLESTFFRTNTAKEHDFSPNLTVYIGKEWKNGHKIEINAGAGLADVSYKRQLVDHEEDESVYSLDNSTENTAKNLLLEGRYSFSSRNWSFSAGVKESLSHAKNSYSPEAIDRLSKNSTYINASAYTRIRNVGIQLSVAGMFEHINTGTMTRETSIPIVSMQLNWRLAKQMRIVGRFSYSPKSASMAQLSSTEQYVDQFIVLKGNKGLKTVYPLGVNLRYETSFLGFDSYLTLSDNIIKNLIYPEYEYREGGTYYKTFGNFDSFNTLKASLNVSRKGILNHLTAEMNLGYIYSRARSSAYTNSQGGFTFSGTINASFGHFFGAVSYTLPVKTLSSPYEISYGVHNNYITGGYRVGNFDISVRAYDLFGKKKSLYHYEKKYPLMQEDFMSYIGSVSTVYIALSYRFDYGKSYKRKDNGLKKVDDEESIIRVL